MIFGRELPDQELQIKPMMMLERGDFPFYSSRVLVAGLIIKSTQDIITEEKETHFNCATEVS